MFSVVCCCIVFCLMCCDVNTVCVFVKGMLFLLCCVFDSVVCCIVWFWDCDGIVLCWSYCVFFVLYCVFNVVSVCVLSVFVLCV